MPGPALIAHQRSPVSVAAMILSPDGHENTDHSSHPEEKGPPDLVDPVHDESVMHWQSQQWADRDPDTDPEDDTELEKFTVDYRYLNDMLVVDLSSTSANQTAYRRNMRIFFVTPTQQKTSRYGMIT